MHKKTQEIFNDEILAEICSRYDLTIKNVKLLGGFESYIYEFHKGGIDHILRITHSLHRTEDEIAAEVDWINYLADNSVSVARAVNSPAGKLIEKVEEINSSFLACTFIKAEGRHIRKDDISEVLFMTLGKLLGKTHALTAHYKPKNEKQKRPQWDVEIETLHEFIPVEQEIVRYKFYKIINQLKILPKDNNSFGLIHTDAHFGNMFIKDGFLTLFDFDDSAYKWFISDIAIVLFYGVMWTPEKKDRQEYGEFIFNSFMKGYRQEYSLDPYWFELMPEFLRLREIVLYAAIHMGFDVPNLKDKWCLNYLNGRKEKIELDRPYLDLNFKKLALN